MTQVHIINLKDYEDTIYSNTNLTREEASTAATYYWNKGLGIFEAIQSIRQPPRFEIIEESKGEIISIDTYNDFWAAVQTCITLDKATEKDFWVATYKHGMPERRVKPKKEDEGISLHFEKI